MRKRHKHLFLFFSGLVILTLLDLSPMFYQRLFGNGGTFVEQYRYDISGDSLLSFLTTEFGLIENESNKPHITSVVPDKNNSGFTYVQIKAPRTQEYIHLWVGTGQEFGEETWITFYGISDSHDHEKSRRINRDYDFIFRNLTINKFERLIIAALNEKGITQHQL